MATGEHDHILAAKLEAVEARLKFLEAGNPYASKEWGDLVAVSGKAKGDVLAAKLLISQLQHALAAQPTVVVDEVVVISPTFGGKMPNSTIAVEVPNVKIGDRIHVVGWKEPS